MLGVPLPGRKGPRHSLNVLFLYSSLSSFILSLVDTPALFSSDAAFPLPRAVTPLTGREVIISCSFLDRDENSHPLFKEWTKFSLRSILDSTTKACRFFPGLYMRLLFFFTPSRREMILPGCLSLD